MITNIKKLPEQKPYFLIRAQNAKKKEVKIN